MKSFLGTFVICFILSYVFLFFGGILIFENLWGIIALVALVVSVLITAFINQDTKIEELEARIKVLESQIKTKE